MESPNAAFRMLNVDHKQNPNSQRLTLLSSMSIRSYYLPHHCIERLDNMTTKLLVIFDASCVTDRNVSLNSVLMVRPVVHTETLVKNRISEIQQLTEGGLRESEIRRSSEIVWHGGKVHRGSVSQTDFGLLLSVHPPNTFRLEIVMEEQ